MKLLLLPDSMCRKRLTFFLAMEEWAARSLPADEYFFIWEVGPTVICGRNQETDKEIDIEFCRCSGIDICRRLSGGGAVLADNDNFMFSYIAPGDDTEKIFHRFTARVAAMLQSLGLEAEARGRNDIYIGGRKISGGAYYKLPGRGIAHSTMLYSFNPEMMRKALTPSRGKLESKGVTSVEASVSSLSAEGLRMSQQEFKDYIQKSVTDDTLTLGNADISAIEEIQRRYDDPAFIFGKKTEYRHTASSTTYVKGAGNIDIAIAIAPDGTIARFDIKGDFFGNRDCGEIEKRLQGIKADITTIKSRLAGFDTGKVIHGLDTRTFTDLIDRTLKETT